MFNFEKEGAVEIHDKDIVYSSELHCRILKSTGKPLNGKYYFPDEHVIRYYKNGEYHREDDLPAVIYKNGDFLYFVNGMYYGTLTADF